MTKFNKVDESSFGINKKLARKYNALVNAIKKNTSYNDGCVCASIESIEYTRQDDRHSFNTIDYIKMVICVFDKQYTLWINNPKALFIDRKYNIIEKVDDLDAEW